MRILVAHNSHKIAGGEQRVFDTETAQLEEAGHEVIRFNPHNDEVDDLNRLTLAAKTIWNQASASQLAALIQRHRPDIAHFHNIVPLLSPSVFTTAKRLHVPIVWTLHNYRLVCPGMLMLRNGKPCSLCVKRRLKTPAIVHKCYRNSRTATTVVTAMQGIHQAVGTWDHIDRFITPSEFARRKFIEGGLPANKIITKCNFVPGDPEVGRGDGNFFLCVGRLSEEKGILSLIEAWQRYSINEKLLIAGEGPAEDGLRNASQTDPNIEFVGRQSPFEVRQLMSLAKATIVPSVWYETFGLVAAESFAVGTPVIASDIGALSELIRPGRNGFLFEPGNSAAIAQKINKFLTSDNDELRLNARVSYEEQYTEKHSLRGLLNIYQEVTGIEVQSPTAPPRSLKV